MTEKQKKLVLKKAYFDKGFNGSFEQIVTGISEKLPNKNDRLFNPDFFKSHEVACIEKSNNGSGLFIRIHGYDKGSIGLVNQELAAAEAELEEHLPPEKRQFLGEEVILYIKGNHILACDLGNRDTFVQNVFGSLAVKAGIIDSTFKLKVSDVPNKTEVKKVTEIGVKKIELGIGGYLASIDELKNKSLGEKVVEKVFGVPDDGDHIRKRANTYGKLILRRSKFKKEEIKKDEWLTGIGEAIIESDADDYIITLEDKSTISTAKLKLSKYVKLKKAANTVSYTDAKNALLQYYNELQNNGSLDW